LPALGITADARDIEAQVALLASPHDMLMAFGQADGADGVHLAAAIARARARGCLTIAFEALGADVELLPPGDAFAWQECVETTYHVLWELVHVFFEHGIDARGTGSHPGASAFLYPFLANAPPNRDAIAADVEQSVIAKARDINALRARTLSMPQVEELHRAAASVRDRLAVGGVVHAFGNGGSATDAMDLVADLRAPPGNLGLAQHPALDLTEDSSILTALSNDVGPDLVFARQLDAYAEPKDVVICFSTSGNSRNVTAALEVARRRNLLTVAFTGYDGGAISKSGLADYVVNAPSEYVPRIQEAHATGYHLLRRLIG
jgi:D-sedoheptulose 7-phosphate isomerase